MPVRKLFRKKPGAASPDHSDHRAISEAAVSQMSPGVQQPQWQQRYWYDKKAVLECTQNHKAAVLLSVAKSALSK